MVTRAVYSALVALTGLLLTVPGQRKKESENAWLSSDVVSLKWNATSSTISLLLLMPTPIFIYALHLHWPISIQRERPIALVIRKAFSRHSFLS